MKSKLIYIIFLALPSLVVAQNFELIKPDVEVLKSQLINTNFAEDGVYLYLIENYKVESEKLEIEIYEYPDYSICGFKQDFQFGIRYSQSQCIEGGGMTSKLTLPKTTKTTAIQWIELISKVYENNNLQVWNKNKTSYVPSNGGAGCYYQLKENLTLTEIEIYCGC